MQLQLEGQLLLDRSQARLMQLLTAAATLVVALGLTACDSGTPAVPTAAPPRDASAAPEPVADASAGADASGEAGGGSTDGSIDDATVSADSQTSYVVCPPGLDASFGSIYARMLARPFPYCGWGSSGCHSTLAATQGGSVLDFSLDASAVYGELLGPDGGGSPAANIAGDAGGTILRVVPGDAGASFLYVKLILTRTNSPYGSGMPLDTPGSVCPEALGAVRQWIDNGAAP
jgi:hypothetical protein